MDVVQAVKRASLSELKAPKFNIRNILTDSNVRVVMISDTHDKHRWLANVPPGDVLIHAGDISTKSTQESLYDFISWFEKFPHKIKVVIGGNHDYILFGKDSFYGTPLKFTPDNARQMFANAGILYLQDQELHIDRLRVYGTPWLDCKSMAFSIKDPDQRRKILENIINPDILITHAPPKGILDLCADGTRLGCEVIAQQIDMINPRLHVFGHVHESSGNLIVNGRLHVNASVVDRDLNIANPPKVHDLKV